MGMMNGTIACLSSLFIHFFSAPTLYRGLEFTAYSAVENRYNLQFPSRQLQNCNYKLGSLGLR